MYVLYESLAHVGEESSSIIYLGYSQERCRHLEGLEIPVMMGGGGVAF